MTTQMEELASQRIINYTIKLEPIFKIKWLKALRSGRYKQGQNVLRSKSINGKFQYCCLGVACNLIERHWKDEGSGHYGWHGIESGQTDRFPFLPNHGVSGLLARANDDGISFEKIADWIEENL